VTLFGLLFTPIFYVIVRGVAQRLDRFRRSRRLRRFETPEPGKT